MCVCVCVCVCVCGFIHKPLKRSHNTGPNSAEQQRLLPQALPHPPSTPDCHADDDEVYYHDTCVHAAAPLTLPPSAAARQHCRTRPQVATGRHRARVGLSPAPPGLLGAIACQRRGLGQRRAAGLLCALALGRVCGRGLRRVPVNTRPWRPPTAPRWPPAPPRAAARAGSSGPRRG